MVKLTDVEATLLLRLVVRSLNKLKGRAIDFGRIAIPEHKGGTDRQYNGFVKEVKDYEHGLRKGLAQSLVDAEVIAAFDEYELYQMR